MGWFNPFSVFLVTQVPSSFVVFAVSLFLSHLVCEVCFIYFCCSEVVLKDDLTALNLLLSFPKIAYDILECSLDFKT